MINLNLPVTFLDTNRLINKKDEQIDIIHIQTYTTFNPFIICILENDKVTKEIKEIDKLYDFDIKFVGTISKYALPNYIKLINLVDIEDEFKQINIIRYNDIFIKNIKILKKIAKNKPNLRYLSSISIIEDFEIPAKFPNKWYVTLKYSEYYTIVDSELPISSSFSFGKGIK